MALGTAILATMALGEGLGASAQEQTWVAAAVAAALAIPVVGVSRRAADRFVYGRRPSPLRALEELGTKLAQLADPRDVPETVVRAVTESLAVGGARLLVGDTVQAAVGTATFEEQFPITHRDERLATLAVSPRPGETTLIARDRSVITRICALAGPALHGARLVNELVEARARVVIAREDERRRLRRDLHDDLAPTLAGLGLSAAVVEKFSRAGDPRAADAATDLAGRLQGASRQVRDIAYNLRPPVLDDRGLVAAIEETIASRRPSPGERRRADRSAGPSRRRRSVCPAHHPGGGHQRASPCRGLVLRGEHRPRARRTPHRDRRRRHRPHRAAAGRDRDAIDDRASI